MGAFCSRLARRGRRFRCRVQARQTPMPPARPGQTMRRIAALPRGSRCSHPTAHPMPATAPAFKPTPRRVRQRKTVSVGVARAAQRRAGQLGMDLPDFCRRTGLAPAELEVPRGRVDAARHLRVAEIFRLCLNGVPGGTALPTMEGLLHDHPLLGGLWCNCPSLGAALQAYVHYRDVLGQLDGVACRAGAQGFELEYLPDDTASPLGASNALGNFLLLAAIVQHYAGATAGAGRAGGVQVDLQLAGLRNLPALPLHVADGPRHRFRVQGAALWQPAGGFNALLHHHFRDELDQELQGLGRDGGLADAVRGQIDALWAGGAEPQHEAGLAAVAERLHLSRWTLRRRLQDEGTSFQEVLDSLRAERAMRLLREPQLSMLEISSRLGFASQGSFTRFFKARFGQPPRRWSVGI